MKIKSYRYESKITDIKVRKQSFLLHDITYWLGIL